MLCEAIKNNLQSTINCVKGRTIQHQNIYVDKNKKQKEIFLN